MLAKDLESGDKLVSDEDFKTLTELLTSNMQCLTKGLQNVLTLSELKQMIETLTDFEDIFQKSDKPLSMTHTTEHTIEVEGRPIKQDPRRLPYLKQAIVKA
jgi:hypothetical protein